MNKWTSMLRSRTFWTGMAMMVVVAANKFLALDLSATEVAEILAGLGTIAASLLVGDWKEIKRLGIAAAMEAAKNSNVGIK